MQDADITVYENGTVLTLDDAHARCAAIAVQGRVVLGTGSREDMRALAGPDAERVDLDGACVLPGIVDSHPHAMHMMAFRIGTVDLLDATNFDDIVGAIRARAAVTPKGEWIVCTPVGEPHYFIRRDYTHLAERRMPERQVLDAAAPEHPVWIMAWAPRTPNVTAFNSLALARLGLNRQMPDRVCDVWFDKDDAGDLTGVLRGKVNNYYGDDPVWHLILRQLPRLPDGIWELAGIAGVQERNAMGVTGLYEAHAMMPPHLDAYRAMAAAGTCTARVVMSLELSGYAFSTMDYSEDEIWALLEEGRARVHLDDARVRTNGVTLSRGGPLSQGYLRMNDPWPGPFGKQTRGKTFFPRAVEQRVVRYCLDHDLRMNMVLGGYRDADEFLATVREHGAPATYRAREWVLQHCYFTSPAQVAAFREHGFHVTSSGSFVYGKADRVKDKFPPEVAADFIAMRRFVESGINFACGSDWGPDSPWRQMALNETREGAASGHRYLESGQALTRLQSLQAFTRAPAAVMQWPELGRLAAGSAADLVIVDRDPFAASVEALAETAVLRTVLDGAAVFDTGAIAGGPMALPPPAAEVIRTALQGAT
jgi:predicted amidohydrolase YtcJ